MNDFYCSEKFWWLTLDAQRRTASSCCAATPQKIDLTWLHKNPGQSFNIPQFLKDRQEMLDGSIPVSSCEDTCWRAENTGLVSRRMDRGHNQRTHSDIHATPEVLNVIISTDCNLTCSYCCKQYSSAWTRDIVHNGPYFNDERYEINNNDRIIMKLGQKAISTSASYQTMLEEATRFKNLKRIEITGGEPLLNNNLPEFISKLSGPVDIFTGLGVDTNRLKRILDQLPDNVTFTVSAENTGMLYEFNRFGNTWDKFRTNLDILSKSFKYKFCNVISNLTIHGLEEFRAEYSTDDDATNYCNDPGYLSVNVIDSFSKTKYKFDNDIDEMLAVEYTTEQKQNFQKYITEFARRRSLDLNIFPEHFVSWINERT